MKIICPDCSAQYDLPAGAIGDKGRKVKCASCSNSWRAYATEDTQDKASPPPAVAGSGGSAQAAMKADPEAEADVEASAVAEAELAMDQDAKDDAEQDAEDDKLFKDSQDVDRVSNLDAEAEADLDAEFEKVSAIDEANQLKPDAEPVEGYEPKPDVVAAQSLPNPQENPEKLKERQEALQKRHAVLARNLPRQRLRRLARLGAAIVLMTIALGSYAFRDQWVSAYPSLAYLYNFIGANVNVIGLELQNVQTSRSLRDGVEVLQIRADLTNVSGRQANVPRVHVEVKGADNSVLYAWIATPQVRGLRPDEQVEFRTELSLPPTQAVEISLEFVEAEDGNGL